MDSTALHFDIDEEARLIQAYKRGDQRAGDLLVRSSLGLVRSIAHDYRLWGSNLEDLIQQGSLGLLKAVERFDAERGLQLRAYAGYWIRAEIREYVVRGYRIVRLGTTRTERKALRTFRVRNIADAAELARESGMPLSRCEQLWPLLSRRDTRIDDSQDAHTPLDRFTRETADPEVLALQSERTYLLQSRVKAALELLNARERRIAEARLMSDEPSTLDALGTELGLSRERVRQLEVVIKSKMREQLTSEEELAA